ncbi:hypothetical protein H257_14115 [Aphanomyces astaci]|uniref:Kinesin-like protein n=1 Tax=Aphanomyces astaci TaxID=112090 RepID=W4FUW3_APHAT|nr:hypothetical protein H257_14115 [Aphanomyces astaci]ETV70453.1 hypothetical protein H257_14115 [Aphanomyces astaci]|eukprot:XP_009840165.1 hypothetical protein H257_14115 [Aphanomyces astaci]
MADEQQMVSQDEVVDDAAEPSTPREPSDNNIRIFLRLKPSKKVSGFFTWEEEQGALEYNIPKDVAAGLINNSRTQYKFKFDSLIGMEAKQEEVFDRVGRPCVQNALEGFNSTIFAYGQTGSGKTFTITGGAERYEDRGIIPRSLSMIFGEMKKYPDRQTNAYISYLEIYNNQGYDLLNEDHQNTKDIEDLPKVSMLEDEDGNCHLRNLSMHRVASEEDALNLLFLGDTNRAVSETSMNLASSRSHCIFTVSLESRRGGGSEVILRSKLHMVDLAGSERAHKTGAKGKVLREATYINTSLHYLEMVIVALHEKNTKGRSHIPYRNSMMTSVLRDSLGGNCKTVMVATASAEKEQTDESLSTCRFAQRVARVRNDAHLNEEVDPVILIRQLKAQIVALQEELTVLKGDVKEGDDLKEYEKDKLRQKVVEYANNPDADAHLNMGEISYTKMRLCFGFLKAMITGDSATVNTTSSTTTSSNQSGHSTNQDGGGSLYSSSDPELHGRLMELEHTIQQRDNEIAILVNMLKQGQGGNNNNISMLPSTSSKSLDGGRSAQSSVAKPPVVLVAGFNVQIDTASLNDPAKAFDVFRDQYPKNDAIRENKALLKKKYDTAKALAATVNEARNSIKELTAKMEKLRTDKAVASVITTNLSTTTESGLVSDDEMAIVAAIDAHKRAYKVGFNQLNDLKKEIQHVQKMLEMGRLKLQKDFDGWYQAQGRGHLVTETLVNKQDVAKPPPPVKAAWPDIAPGGANSTSTTSTTSTAKATTPRQKDEIPKTGDAAVDKDVTGFYEALDILKRRNSRKL